MPLPSVSFEFFPPRSLDASFRLWDAVQTLAPFNPRFVSVTYGAGGSTRALTRDAVTAIRAHTGLNVAAHLTCVDASRAETLAIADEFAASGVTEIVALRGDPEDADQGFRPHPDGFADSPALIEALARRGGFKIRVGAYPESHPDAASAEQNIEWLKRKVDAGADEIITQFFFDPEAFLRFRDACTAAGITVPILPGILPIENWAGVQRFAHKCGTHLPTDLQRAFAKAGRDDHSDLLALAVATELCDRLTSEGAAHLHFYTLNRPQLTCDICQALGLRTRTALRHVA